MEYFYIPELGAAGRQLSVVGQEARHIIKVLRHNPGDELWATDGRGNEFRLVIKSIKSDRLMVRVLEKRPGQREPGRKVSLALAVLKGDKLRTVVEAVTELGVSEILPFVSERVIGRMDEARLHRIRAVAVSGMKTALGTVLPVIRPVVSLSRLISSFSDYQQVIVAYEEEQERGIADVLNLGIRSLLLVIGPEGGFTTDEVAQLQDGGAVAVTLGPRRLRAEIAAIVATGVCFSLTGDLGGKLNSAKGGG